MYIGFLRKQLSPSSIEAIYKDTDFLPHVHVEVFGGQFIKT